MDKQELINRLKKLLTTPSEIEGYDFDDGYDFGIESAISLAKDLDDPVITPEPEKPIIPEYVADWIEWCKKKNVSLLGSIIAVCNDKNIRSLDASGWATKNQETFTKAWFYGYEVEKEKLYQVELPGSHKHGDIILVKDDDGDITYDVVFSDRWKERDYTKLTKEEIMKDHEWAWKYAEEVNNND